MLIALCDDNPQCIEELESRIKAYFKAHTGTVDTPQIFTFSSAVDLLESYGLREYDFAFLDIDMPDINGMELAARIRRMDKRVQITFVTYMEHHLPFGYHVMASGFVVKPFTQEHINSVLDDMMALVDDASRPPLEINLRGGGTASLDIKEIMYIESFGYYMEAVTKQDSRFEFVGKMSALESALAEQHFVRLHRCYLVNLAYIFIRSLVQ